MIRAYIIDDEPPAIRTIAALLQKNSNRFPVDIVGTNSDPVDGLSEIKVKRPNVLFLDIEMHNCNGFELLENIDYTPLLTVFVTAYEDYAVKAFEVNAFQYLVKPVSPIAFSKCLENVSKQLQLLLQPETNGDLESHFNDQITLKSKDGYAVVNYTDIEYIESDGAYSNFHLNNGKKIVYSKNLKHTYNQLNQDIFLRVSRSAITKISCIATFSFSEGGSVTLDNGTELYVGKTYRQEVFKVLREKFMEH